MENRIREDLTRLSHLIEGIGGGCREGGKGWGLLYLEHYSAAGLGACFALADRN